MHKHCFQFLSGLSISPVIPGRNEKQRLCQIFCGWGWGGGGGGRQLRCIMGDMLLCLVYQGVFGHFMPTIPIISEDFRRLAKIPEDVRRTSKHLTEFSLETLSPTQTFKTQLTNLRNTKKQQEATPARTDCYSSESCLNK